MNPNDQQQLAQLISAYETQIAAGNQVDTQRIAKSYPHLADGFRRHIATRTGVLEVGTMIDRYRVTGLIGRGAMGTVYAAIDTRLDREIALKIPDLPATQRDVFLARFQREALLAASLSHPNLCPVYDFGLHDGHPYLTMQRLPGRSLQDVIDEGKTIPLDIVISFCTAIANGLAEMHSKGVVHRDLKPGNVLLDGRGNPVITDFGLAVDGWQQTDVRVTQPNTLIGSPAYMSPEQVQCESSIDSRSDLYSLGVILFELTTGRLPFTGTIASLLAAIVSQPPPSLRSLRPDVPHGLDAICQQLLEKDRTSRLPTAETLALRLRLPELEKPSFRELELKQTAILPRRSRLAVSLFSGLLLASAIAVFVWTIALLRNIKSESIVAAQSNANVPNAADIVDRATNLSSIVTEIETPKEAGVEFLHASKPQEPNSVGVPRDDNQPDSVAPSSTTVELGNQGTVPIVEAQIVTGITDKLGAVACDREWVSVCVADPCKAHGDLVGGTWKLGTQAAVTEIFRSATIPKRASGPLRMIADIGGPSSTIVVIGQDWFLKLSGRGAAALKVSNHEPWSRAIAVSGSIEKNRFVVIQSGVGAANSQLVLFEFSTSGAPESLAIAALPADSSTVSMSADGTQISVGTEQGYVLPFEGNKLASQAQFRMDGAVKCIDLNHEANSIVMLIRKPKVAESVIQMADYKTRQWVKQPDVIRVSKSLDIARLLPNGNMIYATDGEHGYVYQRGDAQPIALLPQACGVPHIEPGRIVTAHADGIVRAWRLPQKWNDQQNKSTHE